MRALRSRRGSLRGAYLAADSLRCAGLCLGCLFFTIFRRSRSFKRMEEACGNAGHVIDRREKRRLVCLGRMCEAADLAHKLERRRPNLFLCNGWVEIEKRLDVPAHASGPPEKRMVSC